MNLEELEKLADAVWEKGLATEVHLGYTGVKAGTYVVRMQNKTLKQLIELCRLQHEALKGIPKNLRYSDTDDAIAAYEQFERGE